MIYTQTVIYGGMVNSLSAMNSVTEETNQFPVIDGMVFDLRFVPVELNDLELDQGIWMIVAEVDGVSSSGVLEPLLPGFFLSFFLSFFLFPLTFCSFSLLKSRFTRILRQGLWR